jgi:hypothetical protein
VDCSEKGLFISVWSVSLEGRHRAYKPKIENAMLG